MHVYSIESGEWVEIPYRRGKSPAPRYDPYVFSIGDSFVLVGGHTSSYYGEVVKYTWEWSLTTREWTRRGLLDVDVPKDIVGATLGNRHHVFLMTFTEWQSDSDSEDEIHQESYHDHLCYSGGNWVSKQDDFLSMIIGNWNQFDHCTTIAKSVSDHHMLVFSQVKSDNHDTYETEVTSECFMRDEISLDLVPLRVLPPVVLEDDHPRYPQILKMNPSTLLVIRSDVCVVINIDPYFLSPEYHTSMVGHGKWER
ncbi:hypothetical protein KIPB_002283 [Kipferlia bialata]|uniref:Kelch-type beta propeller n=1 Tax=Kipferlia bialata TaxID=797122 RepID=A0A391NJA3_9EUKA|nr:hypothetical protein KIPB_002283 [Kipferlia bialata]|eukprot:g2283.t1